MSSRYSSPACPPWVSNRRNRPSDYTRLYEELKDFNGTVNIFRISKLLERSNLESQQLDRIWNTVNNKSRALSEQEFCILLALVALSQRGTPVYDTPTLFKMTLPPVPDFTRVQSQQSNTKDLTYSFPGTNPNPDSDFDDEFSDFQSGLVEPVPPKVSADLMKQPFTKSIPFSPVHHTSGSQGSRLANYNLGFRSEPAQPAPPPTSTADNLLIGDEDKYSAFRDFLSNNDVEALVVQKPLQSFQPQEEPQPSGTDDFGEFQSFTNAEAEAEDEFGSFTKSEPEPKPQAFPSLPIVYNPPVSISIPAQDNTTGSNDDFGDFVSFETEVPENPQPNSRNSLPPIAFPPIKLVLNEFSAVQNTSNISVQGPGYGLEELQLDLAAPTSSSSYEGSEGSKGHDSAHSFQPFAFTRKSSLKTTLIGCPTFEDPFAELVTSDFGPFSDSSPGSLTLNPGSGHELKVRQSSPETQSVCSLDLGNYGVSDLPDPTLKPVDGGTGAETGLVEPEFPPVSNSGSSSSKGPTTGFAGAVRDREADKYSGFKEEVDIMKRRCTSEWRRCMKVCIKLIESAGTIFNSVSSSDVIRQVISSEKGHSYVLSLREVYLVACRVYHSWMKLSAGESAGDLHQRLALAWDSFVPFLVGSALEDSINQTCVISEDELADCSRVCGICLVGTKPALAELEEESAGLLLDYDGGLYHLACANLWVNEIGSVLPTLSLTSV